MVSSGNLWYLYGQQILQQAVPTFDPTKQVFSLASSTLSLDLGNQDPQVVNGYIYGLGNTIPAASPSYTPASALVSSYQLFLDSIDLGGDPNPNLNAGISLAASDMTAAQTNFINVQGQAIASWKTYQAINPNIAFPDYATQFYTTYIDARNALSAATSKWQGLMSQKYGSGYEIIAAARARLAATGGATDVTMQNKFNMAVKTGSIAALGGVPTLPGQTAPAPASSLISSFAPSFALQGFTDKFQEWQANSGSNAKPAATIEVGGDAGRASWSTMGWSSESAGLLDLGFFEAWGETSSSSSAESDYSFNDGFQMTVDFAGLSSFIIEPGQWFDQGIIDNYKGKLVPNSPPFFAATGSLARFPAQAVIGFNPKITLMLSNSEYASFKTTFQSQTTAAMAFGPFVLGETHSSTYADKSGLAYDDNQSTITISPPASAIPVLLGIVSTRLDV